MQALQALFLSHFSQAELFTYHDAPVFHGYARFRWQLQEIEQSNNEPSTYVLSVQDVEYPNKTPSHGWGEPKYAEPHRRKTFTDSRSLLQFLEEQGLPRSWEPVKDASPDPTTQSTPPGQSAFAILGHAMEPTEESQAIEQAYQEALAPEREGKDKSA